VVLLLGAAVRDDAGAALSLKVSGDDRVHPAEYGRHMFHPHQHWLADRCVMVWFAAI
jgi:hypothetical protein